MTTRHALPSAQYRITVKAAQRPPPIPSSVFVLIDSPPQSSVHLCRLGQVMADSEVSVGSKWGPGLIGECLCSTTPLLIPPGRTQA
ncbi:hypothetical protein PISMIDRAFT_684020 [Pisolithus microcarpus 441]|uniref:Uncharacterized protein n=1 Tax=Pisolithus microcarpus 441 TaxID=765257 RepID=A0A0C9Z881_9AGAM|nr:hypothetical protein PISMIDRAFT_684020 [Pisolithus microcarpus 441]